MFDKITTQFAIKVARLRSIDILMQFKYVLRSRKHTELTRVVEALFPKLFGFEYCSILFAELKTGNLFKIVLIDKNFKTDEEK